MGKKSKTPSKGNTKSSKTKEPTASAIQKNTLNRYFKVVDVEPVTKNDINEESTTLKVCFESKNCKRAASETDKNKKKLTNPKSPVKNKPISSGSDENSAEDNSKTKESKQDKKDATKTEIDKIYPTKRNSPVKKSAISSDSDENIAEDDGKESRNNNKDVSKTEKDQLPVKNQQISTDTEENNAEDDRKECKYGDKCYQTNKQHLKKFKHAKPPTKSPKKQHQSNRKSPRKTNIDAISESDSENEEKVKKNKRKSEEELKSDKLQDAKKQKIRHENDPDENKVTPDLKPSDLEDAIKNIFAVEGMPTDFYHFWKFCTTVNPKNPLSALKDSLGFELVGPFEVLNEPESFLTSDQAERDKMLCKSRYYYDPPEFQTCIISKEEDPIKDEKLAGFHLGYYRDDPTLKSAFVAFNTPGMKYTPASCKFQPLGDNLFGALSSEIAHRLQQLPKKDKKRESLEKLKTRMKRFMSDRDLTYNLDRVTQSMKSRQKLINSKCFHGAGIRVKVENDVGYRELPETDANLRSLFTKITNKMSNPNSKKDPVDLMAPIDKLVNLVQFANDECDFGMGLELGLDLFSYGDPNFHPYIMQLLPLAYQLLNRAAYSKIIEAHLKLRDKMTGANHWLTDLENA